MKKLVLIGMALCFAVSLALAQEATTTTTTTETAPTSTPAATEITLKGDVIDNMCAGTVKPEDLANFVKTHTKQCALMEPCVASGYSIFADGVLYRFDKESNAKVVEFLKKEESKLQVVVTAKKVGEELSLVTIENQM